MADALRCTQCGATLPVGMPERASVPCPSCGTVNRISSELLDALHGHRREVDEQRGQAAEAERQTVSSELSRSFGAGSAAVFVGSWLLAAVVAMPGTTLARASSVAIFLMPFVAFAPLARIRQHRLARTTAAGRAGEQPVLLHCPSCGGQSEFLPDMPVLPCRYCSGTFAADEPARAELLARARASVEHEQRRALVARWRLAAQQNREPRTDLVPYMVIGGLGSLWVIGTMVADARWLFAAARHGSSELLAMNAVALAIVAGVGIPLWIRRRRSQRWFAALERLAACGGTLGRETSAFAEWLAAHWTGEFDSARICAGPDYGFIAGTRPPWWAISIAPRSLAERSIERHLRVLLPGQRGSLLTAWSERLEPLGFGCRIVDGGLVATLTRAELDAMVAQPDRLERLEAVLRDGDVRDP